MKFAVTTGSLAGSRSCRLSELVPYSVTSGWHVEWNKAAVSTGIKWRPGSSIAPDAWLTRRVPQMTTEVTGSGTTARKDQIVVDGSGGTGTSTDQERDAEASK